MNRPAPASDRGWRNSAVHREVDNRHAFWVLKLILGIAIAIAPLGVYLLHNMSYVQTSYAIEEVRNREARLIEWEHRYTIERDLLQSLPEVEKRAGARLGLLHPQASRVVVVSAGELPRPVPSGTTSPRPPSH
jgi:hypothetical protein